jgi:hypothetical protein
MLCRSLAMFLRLVPPLLFASALPALAQEPPCTLQGGAEVCVPVLACVADTGLWIDGRAYGSRQGRIEAVMSDGTFCSGTWEVRGILGMGRSDIVCDDGRKARIWYTYLDGRTGTAVGTGRSNFGERINAWSGQNVLEYLGQGSDGRPASCENKPLP